MLLLDNRLALWAAFEPERLSPKAARETADAAPRRYGRFVKVA